MKFIIIHGAFGSSRENWFPWLRHKLEHLGNEVIVPDFPTPQGQSIDIWMHELNKKAPEIDSETIFIGHSVGCAFILSVLEKLKCRVKACYFVAGFIGPLGIDLDKINKPFAQKNFDWEKIKANCEKFVLFNSDNDPFIAPAKGEELKAKLGDKAELVVVAGAGHFNKKSNYTEFPLLFDKILESARN